MDYFSALDWGAILKIVGVDIMLGVDNAIVIALACASLPPEMRKKAIGWGTAGAVGLRAVLLAMAGFLLGLPYVKLIAGAYLLYLGYALLKQEDEAHDIAPADKVWTAVKTIIVADFWMSLDNVFAVAAAAESAGEHSTIYAIMGIILSIPIIVYGAQLLTGVMAKYPILTWLGAGMLGWVAAEMIITDDFVAAYVGMVHSTLGDHTHLLLKALGFGGVMAAAYVSRILFAKDEKPVPAAS